MLAYATNRVHGLGWTPEEFWSSTQRELYAHDALNDAGRLHAELLSALYNGPMAHPDGKTWTAEMFLPGYQSGPDESWRAVKGMTANQFRKATPQEKATMDANTKAFNERASKAAAMQASGAPRDEVIRIMEGR